MAAREAARRQGSRTRARRLAMQALYQWQLTGQAAETIAGHFVDTESARGADLEYFRTVLEEVTGHATALEGLLAEHVDRPLAQLDPVERAILLLAVYELSARPDVPYRVVINEAVELARRYGATGSHRYVNGVLDQAALALRPDEAGTRRNNR